MSWLKKIGQWFDLVVDWSSVYKWVFVEDSPDILESKTIYLIGDFNNPWAASFICPCGCNETISLSLIPTDRPKWKVFYNKNKTISLRPSIHRLKNCKSHFFIQNGKVVWARDLPYR